MSLPNAYNPRTLAFLENPNPALFCSSNPDAYNFCHAWLKLQHVLYLACNQSGSFRKRLYADVPPPQSKGSLKIIRWTSSTVKTVLTPFAHADWVLGSCAFAETYTIRPAGLSSRWGSKSSVSKNLRNAKTGAETAISYRIPVNHNGYLWIYIYICMYVCMHVCMYVCRYTVDVDVYVYVYVSMYECMYVCIYVCMYVWMDGCMHACIYIIQYNICVLHIYIYICIYIHTYICIYMYIHIYICTYIYIYIRIIYIIHKHIYTYTSSIHIYIYTNIHTNIYTYTNIHIH